MKKENLHLLINSLIGLLVGVIILLSYIMFIPTSKLDKQLGYKAKLELVEKTAETPGTIVSINKILKGKTEKGLLYESKKENDYGDVKIFIAVDLENNIIASYSEVDQDFPASNHAREVDLYIKGLRGSNMLEPKVSADIAKPTVSVTLGTLDELLKDIAKDLGAVDPLSAIEQAYGIDVIRGIKVNTTDLVVLSVEQAVVNSEVVGHIYVAKEKIDYDKGGTPESGIIEIEVYVDKNNIFIGYDFITYEHTGSYQKIVIQYLDSLIEKNTLITEVKGTFNKDDFANATYSSEGVESLLEQIGDFITAGNELTVGPVIEINSGTINSKREIKLGNVLVSTLYELEDNIEYVTNEGPQVGKIVMHLIIDNDQVIKSYFFIEYEHTPKWQTHVKNFLNNAIIKNITIDDMANESTDSTNATYTNDGIKKLIKDLATYLGEV